uniref:Uncharacterized protein n=1 Tax=Oreochromis niloticus TaxID=8128 RepID=A0A669CY46_ORENI
MNQKYVAFLFCFLGKETKFLFLIFTQSFMVFSSVVFYAIHLLLSDLYKTSAALGRYFFNTEIRAVRNGSVIADYKLTFQMPEEEKDQLRNFTLSRQMVYNVFRQFLYDQELPESDPMFIDPASLKMVLGN